MIPRLALLFVLISAAQSCGTQKGKFKRVYILRNAIHSEFYLLDKIIFLIG